MRKFIIGVVLLLAACGGGGSGGGGAGSASNPLADAVPATSLATNFTGNYTYKDDDCTGRFPIEEFSINQTGITATGTNLADGKKYALSGVHMDGQDGLYSTELDCVIFFIRDASDLNDSKIYSPSVSASIGDLESICSDNSEDELCVLTYN